uniref:Obscurin-like protein 1 n=1 Tax=Sinocyclocheilus anshuiensis TaxID=1608454 RepID=A0A671KM82_9TELE
MDVFGGAPRFLAYPRPVVVQSGTDAVLKCQIGGDPRPAVIWERNNEKIHPEGRYRLFEDGNVYNLIITSVTVEDSGQYICKAKNCIGETYAAATLKVQGEAQEMEFREENKPRFLIKPLSTRVGRGEDAVFSCKLWGNPRPEVMWEKDGKKLNEIFESAHFAISYQDGGWFQLKIFKTRAPDGGVYTCKARNEFGESLAGAVLLVDARPGHEDEGNPKVKMFAVTEGKHAKFRCYVTGKPKPEILWRKDGRLILSGRRYLLYEDREGYFTLKVLYCKQQDNGVYVCSASNTAGQTLSAVHLIVKEPPVRFKQPLNDLQVWERDLAVLECEVPEDSVLITWYLEDRRLQPGAKYGMEEWGTKRRLTIRDIGVDDDGIYLCEMADGGRSIAEVAVKGTIVRKLPRKVDVLEGENAAFCVEVEEEEMDIHWYKDGTELRETHQTILKSFGRTHILVFVNTTPQDSGLVMFYVGRSKTSSQLRVKAARHCPPSCPIGVQINTERANAALLSWFPAQDSRKNPPSGYIIERQEVGSQEWLQCLTTDSATSVEILGDSVPCEADYRFRICSVNKYGRSGNVEFPRAAHLVPVARIQAPLQDALVPEGQDACFTIELSASVIGTWFLNGNQLQDDERFSIRRSRTHQSLRIRGVRDTDNGAEITFIAYGIRDSAALYIQAPPVRFSVLPEDERNKFIEAGSPIALQCELSDPLAQVSWYKDGVKLLPQNGLDFKSKGTERQMIVQTAEFYHSGLYSCKTRGCVTIFFCFTEPPVMIVYPKEDVHLDRYVPEEIVLSCELSRPNGKVTWFKDGQKLQESENIKLKTEGPYRRLKILRSGVEDSGEYVCDTNTMHQSQMELCQQTSERMVLSCEISRPNATVRWYRDGLEVEESDSLILEVDGVYRRLIIPKPTVKDSAEYVCDTADDSVTFFVNIAGVKMAYGVEKLVGDTVVLECEVSRPNAEVSWKKDGVEIEENSNITITEDGTSQQLTIHSAAFEDAGQYVCDARDDVMDFLVKIKETKCRFVASDAIVLKCELSRANGVVGWLKDNEKIEGNEHLICEEEGTFRSLNVLSAELKDSGEYICDAQDDKVVFSVTVEVETLCIKSLNNITNISAYEEDSVTLHATVNRVNAPVKWQRGHDPIRGDRFHTTSDGNNHYLTINPLKRCDTGEYTCHVESDEMHVSVHVKGKTREWVKFSKPLENVVGLKGSDVVLKCELYKSKGDVQWLKGSQEIAPNRHFTIRAEGRVRSLTIHDVTEDDAGEYACESKDERTSATVVVNSNLYRSLMPFAEEFGEATLEVEVSHETAEVRWMRQGVVIHPGSKFTLKQNGKKRSLTIHKLTLSDRGTYSWWCHQLSKINPSFPRGMPVCLTEIQTYERETASFEVELSHSNVEGVWQKDGHILKNNNRLRMTAKRRVHSLTISNLTLDDTGTYIFSVDNIRSIARLEVKEKKLEILQSLEDLDIQEGQNAVFMCEVSLDDVPGEWFKNGEKIKPTSTIKIRQEGTKHFLLICNVKEDDSGEIKFVAKNLETTACLEVEALPANIVKPLQDKTALEKTRVILDCTVTNPRCSIRWYKGPNVILPSERFEICSEGCYRKLVIQQVLLEDEGTYSVQVGNYTSSAKLTLEGKANSVLSNQL